MMHIFIQLSFGYQTLANSSEQPDYEDDLIDYVGTPNQKELELRVFTLSPFYVFAQIISSNHARPQDHEEESEMNQRFPEQTEQQDWVFSAVFVMQLCVVCIASLVTSFRPYEIIDRTKGTFSYEQRAEVSQDQL
jgi:hypothetical protein